MAVELENKDAPNHIFDLSLDDDEKVTPIQTKDISTVEDAALDRVIKIASKDGLSDTLTVRQLSKSVLLMTAAQGDVSATEIDVPAETYDVLKFALEYLKHYNGKVPYIIPFPLKSNDLNDTELDKWDIEFIDRVWDTVEIHRLIALASYLDIKPLVFVACAKLGTMLKGRTKGGNQKAIDRKGDGR